MEMIRCEDCGRMVPSMNMEIHTAHACPARKRAAFNNNENRRREGRQQQSDIDDPMDTDVATGDDDIALMNDTSNAAIVGAATAAAAASRIPAAAEEEEPSDEEADVVWLHSRRRQPPRAPHGDWSAGPSQRRSRRRPRQQDRPDNTTPTGGILHVADIVDLLNDSIEDDDKNEDSSEIHVTTNTEDSSSSSSSNNQNQWSCPRCTLLNPNSAFACEACLCSRPSSSSQSSATTRDDHRRLRTPDPVRRERLVDDAFDENLQQHSSPVFMSAGGALLGGVLGGAAAYMRGRPIHSGALEGAMGGAASGAVLNEMMQLQQQHQSQHQSQAEAPALSGGGNINNRSSRSSSRTTRTTSRSTNISSSQTANTSARAATSSRSGGSRRSRRRQSPQIMTTVVTNTNGNVTVRRGVANSSGSRGAAGDSDVETFPDPSMLLSQDPQLMALLLQSFQNINAHAAGANMDGMNYEQLLQMFGDGSENLGADEGLISSMPTSTVGPDPQKELPGDKLECLICLESFAAGDKRKILPCLHGFHANCIDKWLRTNGACPICKHRISSQE